MNAHDALETVAAQRDEMSMKNREMARQLDAANAEIARLKGGVAPAAPAVPEVPSPGVAAVPTPKQGKSLRKTGTVR